MNGKLLIALVSVLAGLNAFSMGPVNLENNVQVATNDVIPFISDKGESSGSPEVSQCKDSNRDVASSNQSAGQSSEMLPNSSRLGSIYAGTVVATQGGGYSLGFLARYQPEFMLGAGPQKPHTSLSVGVNLGLSAFNYTGYSNFLVFEYGAFLAYHPGEYWDWRVMVGGQSWAQDYGTGFSPGFQAMYHIGGRKRAFLDNVFISYSPVFMSTVAHQVGVGVGFEVF